MVFIFYFSIKYQEIYWVILQQHITSRKHAKCPPQKYQNEDEPVPMLVLVPIHLGTGTFGVDETYGWALGTSLTPTGT